MDLNNRADGPLARRTESNIKDLLRGFSDATITGALALRTKVDTGATESLLLGILTFYLPADAKRPALEPTGNERLREDLGLDSLALSEAMFKIEELFDVRIENSELAGVDTLSDARRLLMEKLESADGEPE